jgi:hypothetical protein
VYYNIIRGIHELLLDADYGGAYNFLPKPAVGFDNKTLCK